MNKNFAYSVRLDGLRFIAIFMVLLEHFAMFIGSPISAGFYGVNLFFVLSGFLITSILLKTKEPNIGRAYLNFITRRALRIFPLYYLVVFLLFFAGAPNINERLPYLLTYTYNYILASLEFPEDPYRPFWSLSVEEQFYLFFPLVALVFKKNSNIFALICLIFIVIAFLQMFFSLFIPSIHNYTSLLTNIAPLSTGALGAIILKKSELNHTIFKSKYTEFFVFISIFLVNIFLDLQFQLFLCAFLNLFLVVKAYEGGFLLNWFDKLLINRRLVFIGRISYGIYVYHFLVGYYFTKYLFDPLWQTIPFKEFGILSKVEFHAWIVKFPIFSLITIGIAYISFRYFEQPFLKLKDKYFA